MAIKSMSLHYLPDASVEHSPSLNPSSEDGSLQACVLQAMEQHNELCDLYFRIPHDSYGEIAFIKNAYEGLLRRVNELVLRFRGTEHPMPEGYSIEYFSGVVEDTGFEIWKHWCRLQKALCA